MSENNETEQAPRTVRMLKYAKDLASKTITVTYEDSVDGDASKESVTGLLGRMYKMLGEVPLSLLPIPLESPRGEKVLSLQGDTALIEAWESPEAAMNAIEDFKTQAEFTTGDWKLVMGTQPQA